MAVGEEELERFERDAQCAGAHGGSKRGWQYSVGSRQSEGAKDEEEESGEDGKYGHIAEVAVPIGPVPHPLRDPPHLAHVRRRRERTDQDRREQRERESEKDKL